MADEVFDVGVWWGINWLMLGDVLRDQMFEFGVVWGSSIKFEVWWIIKCSILGAWWGYQMSTDLGATHPAASPSLLLRASLSTLRSSAFFSGAHRSLTPNVYKAAGPGRCTCVRRAGA